MFGFLRFQRITDALSEFLLFQEISDSEGVDSRLREEDLKLLLSGSRSPRIQEERVEDCEGGTKSANLDQCVGARETIIERRRATHASRASMKVTHPRRPTIRRSIHQNSIIVRRAQTPTTTKIKTTRMSVRRFATKTC